MKYANLHMHSTFSDAGFTPSQLVYIGKALGYRAMALTDHETDGGVTEFMHTAQAEGILSLAGIEFYGMEDGEELHLIALDFDRNDPGLRAFVRERCELELECTRKRVERGIRLGWIQGMTFQDVLDTAEEGVWVCVSTVMRTMRRKKLVPPDFDWAAFRKNVFKGPEALALAPEKPPAEAVIRMVRKAGGVIALAHPYRQNHFVEKLVGYGLNGIEVSHPELYENTAYLALQAADTYGLYHCGGTDHFGPMSCGGGNLAIPVFNGITEEEFTAIKERRLG